MLFVLLACPLRTPPESTVPPEQVMPTADPEKEPELQPSTVNLDGEILDVVWDDGDTFHVSGGKKLKARLKGFNTLESYGPVHRWGEWNHAELYDQAMAAGESARAKGWVCTDTGNGGGYGRALIDCPDLRTQLLKEGLAHVFSIDEPPLEEDILAMRDAMAFKRGMWSKGVPDFLITSVHSSDERPEESTYNRLCDLRTGMCEKRSHTDIYSVCQEVCVEDSCMIFVPYKYRYPGEHQASCMKQ